MALIENKNKTLQETHKNALQSADSVDIAVLDAKLFIEVDGLQHFTDPTQIIRYFKRSHYSEGDDFSTFYVTNQIIDRCLDQVVDALVEVIKQRRQL